MPVSIENKKIELIQWLSTLEDQSLIDKLLKLRDAENTDWWQELSAIERASIEKGIKEAEEGKLKPHSAVRAMYEKWL